MAAAEALLEYASVDQTDNDRESAQWGSAGQTEEIEVGDRDWFQLLEKQTQKLSMTIIWNVNIGHTPATYATAMDRPGPL